MNFGFASGNALLGISSSFDPLTILTIISVPLLIFEVFSLNSSMDDINDVRLDWINNAAKQIENTGESPERSVERAMRLMEVVVAHSEGRVLEK